MEPKIVQRYNDDILHEAMTRFGIEEDKIELLDGFESYIYDSTAKRVLDPPQNSKSLI